MTKLKALGFMLAFIVVCYALALGVHALVGRYLDKPASSAVVSCAKKGQSHLVIIKNNTGIPASINAKLCDTLTIKNTDSQIRLMAFGVHDDHQPYDGVTEKVLDIAQSFSVTLNQAGTFKFHDHLDDSVQGTFTVN